MTTVSTATLPTALIARPQWVVWRSEPDPKKPDKPKKEPYDAKTGHHASSTDRRTWCSYKGAMAAVANYTGLGFVFTKEDPYTGIDLDGCITDDGTIAPWALDIITRCASYAEISPSGTGVKLWVEGTLSSSRKKKIVIEDGRIRPARKGETPMGGIEIYDSGRYFTVTGRKLPSATTEVRNAQGVLDELHALLSPPEVAQPTITRPTLPKQGHVARWAEDKMQWIEAQMRDEPEGNLHNRRLELGKLAGGLVALDLFSADEAEQRIYNARVPRSHPHEERKAIRDGIETGRASPLEIPRFPTDQALILKDGVACCPSCETQVRRSRYDYPGTTTPGWYCPRCKGVMEWPAEAYTPRTNGAEAHAASTLTRAYDVLADHAQRTPMAEPSTGDSSAVSRPRSWLNADEIDQITDPTFLINDFLVVGQVTVVAGAGDSGKTFIVLDAALRTAEHYNVMYVAGEDAPGIKLRRNAWWTFWRRPRPERFWMWAEPFSLFDESSVRDFLQQIAELDIKLIVLDTLSQCSIGADENGTRDMSIVMGNAQRIASMTGAAVLIIHHSGKDGNGYRGNSTIKFNTYGFYDVTKSDDTVALTPVRVKNAQGIKPRHFRFISVPVGDKESAVVAPASKVMPSRRLTDDRATILTMLALMTDSVGGAKTSELEKAIDLKGGSFFRPLKALKLDGYIEERPEKAGSKLIISTKGRQALQEHSDDPSISTTTSDIAPDVMFEVNTALTTTTTSELPALPGSKQPLTTTTTTSPFRGGSGSCGSSEVAGGVENIQELPTLPDSGVPQMYGFHALDIPATAPEPTGDVLFADDEPDPPAAPRLSERELRELGYRWVKIAEEWHLYDPEQQRGRFPDRDDAVDAARDLAQQPRGEQ